MPHRATHYQRQQSCTNEFSCPSKILGGLSCPEICPRLCKCFPKSDNRCEVPINGFTEQPLFD